MGIVSSFVNNLTTNGVLTADAINNASLNSITSIAGAGDFKLISEATASSSASIDFTLGSYKEYQFYFVNIHPQNNNSEFQFQCSIDNGSTYGVTLTSTHFRTVHRENDSFNTLGYNSTYDLAQSTAYQQLTRDTSNDADISANGFLDLFNPSSTTYVKHFICTTATTDTDPASENEYVAGYFNTTSALTNIRFKFDSGNIDAGTIKMFGIV